MVAYDLHTPRLQKGIYRQFLSLKSWAKGWRTLGMNTFACRSWIALNPFRHSNRSCSWDLFVSCKFNASYSSSEDIVRTELCAHKWWNHMHILLHVSWHNILKLQVCFLYWDHIEDASGGKGVRGCRNLTYLTPPSSSCSFVCKSLKRSRVALASICIRVIVLQVPTLFFPGVIDFINCFSSCPHCSNPYNLLSSAALWWHYFTLCENSSWNGMIL